MRISSPGSLIRGGISANFSTGKCSFRTKGTDYLIGNYLFPKKNSIITPSTLISLFLPLNNKESKKYSLLIIKNPTILPLKLKT